MSWCNVSECDNDFQPEFYRQTVHTARQTYRCCECGDEIKQGDRYEYVSGKWGGYLDTFRTCLMCVDIRKHFQPDGWLHGTLGDALNANLHIIKGWWLMDPKDKTIAGLVGLVCELLEGPTE